jgi:hypothetical protein
MSARKKLNQGYLQGSLVVAGVVGFFCQSWTVFWIATAILVASSIHSGEIRLTARKTQRSVRSRGPVVRRSFYRRRR